MYKTIAFQLMGKDQWFYTVVNIHKPTSWNQAEYFVISAEEAFENRLEVSKSIFASLDAKLEIGFGMVMTQFIVAYKEVVTA